MNIVLKDACGKQTITREDGQIVNDMIINAWANENKIKIDFSNILIASVSFLDEAFGKLAFYFSKEVLQNKLSFENMEEFDRALLNDIFMSRFHQKELGDSKPKRKRARQK